MEQNSTNKRTFFGLHIDDKSTPKKLLVVVIGLWAASGIIIYFIGKNDGEWTTRGQIGDMFGAVNALFSGLAFAGIIYTILLQREELREQRHELELTRLEFKQQNDTLKLQRFESTFFNMMDLHNRLIQEFTFDERNEARKGDGKIFTGRDIFEYFAESLFHQLHGTDKINQDTLRAMEKTYQDNYAYIGTELDLYLQSVTRLLRFVQDSTFITDNDRKFYKSFVESSMSRDEKCVIYYHLSLAFKNDTFEGLMRIETETKFVSSMGYWLFNDSHSELKKTWRKKNPV